MRKLEKRKHGIYAKQYKNYVYTIERVNNTVYGHPNFEIVIYELNKRFALLGDVYHHSGYDDVYKYVENFIEENYGKEVI